MHDHLGMVEGFIPSFNNRRTILQALRSMLGQGLAPKRVRVHDDGSYDGTEQLVCENGFQFESRSHQGRGAVRARGVEASTGEFLLCCDATMELDSDFLAKAMPWFENPQVAAVFGRVAQPPSRSLVDRWRARHLFKMGYPMNVAHHSLLATYGAILRVSAVLAVGNFRNDLVHNEDRELGERLLRNGFDVIFDPGLVVWNRLHNPLPKVFERYWRWHVGLGSVLSFYDYLQLCWYSVKVMAYLDLAEGDPGGILFSLLIPHYQFWKSSRVRMAN